VKKTLVSVAATAVLSSSFVSYASANTHKVESGDSLWSIAGKYDTTIANLQSLNKLQSEMIFPNQVLKVTQNSTPAVTPPKKEEKPSPSTGKTYTVKSGDTLGKIALNHSVSLSDLMSWNGIKNHLIYPGQVLKVTKGATAAPQAPTPAAPGPVQPKPNAGTASYKVVSGDTLSHISVKFDMSVAELKSLNGLKNDFLRVGQVLKVVKNAENKPTPPAVTPAKPQPSQDAASYTVVPGDSLSLIAIKFDVSVAELKSWNGLNSDFIRVGQVLSVKGKASSEVTPPSQSNPSSFSVDRLLSEAKSHMGTPYVWGGSSVGGFDCSGYIYYVYKQAGLSINRLSSEGYYSRSYYISSPQPGDLVFFENTYKKGISHLGIYLGNNQFIHAGDNGVQITSLDNSYWKSKFDGFKRFYEL
jgi:LysM repeat protein